MQADIHPDFVRKVKAFIAYMRPVLREYHEIFTGNVIAQERLKGTGVLTREDAISFGATGGTGRAAGWACDVRKRHPYAVYGKVDFEEALFTEGDCLARYICLLYTSASRRADVRGCSSRWVTTSSPSSS